MRLLTGALRWYFHVPPDHTGDHSALWYRRAGAWFIRLAGPCALTALIAGLVNFDPSSNSGISIDEPKSGSHLVSNKECHGICFETTTIRGHAKPGSEIMRHVEFWPDPVVAVADSSGKWCFATSLTSGRNDITLHIRDSSRSERLTVYLDTGTREVLDDAALPLRHC
jgi:hypothetical protein